MYYEKYLGGPGRLERLACALLAAAAATPGAAAGAAWAALAPLAAALALAGHVVPAVAAAGLSLGAGAWATHPLHAGVAAAALVGAPLACTSRSHGAPRVALTALASWLWPAGLLAAAMHAPAPQGFLSWLYTPWGASVAALAAALALVAVLAPASPAGGGSSPALSAWSLARAVAAAVTSSPIRVGVLFVYGLTLAMGIADPALLAPFAMAHAARLLARRRGLSGDDAQLLVYAAAYAVSLLLTGTVGEARDALAALGTLLTGLS